MEKLRGVLGGLCMVGYLDHETEEKFENIWRNLSENNITKYGVESEVIFSKELK